MKLKKVSPFIRNKKGEVIGFNISADAANDDWIRAARLRKEGKLEKLEELENTEMYQIIEEKDKKNKNIRHETNSN